MRCLPIIFVSAMLATTPAWADQEQWHNSYPRDPDKHGHGRDQHRGHEHEHDHGRFGDGYYGYQPNIIAPIIPLLVPYGVAPARMVYVCDNPRGVYPQVSTCSVPWRPVPAGP